MKSSLEYMHTFLEQTKLTIQMADTVNDCQRRRVTMTWKLPSCFKSYTQLTSVYANVYIYYSCSMCSDFLSVDIFFLFLFKKFNFSDAFGLLLSAHSIADFFFRNKTENYKFFVANVSSNCLSHNRKINSSNFVY